MRKQFLFLVLLVATTGVIQAQSSGTTGKPFKADLGINLGTGLNNVNGVAFGADVRLAKNIGNSLYWTITPGYTHFSKPGNGFFALKSGLKTDLGPKVYFQGEVGIGIYTQGGESFIFAPSLGTQISKKVDLGFKYERFGSYWSQLAFRVGVGL